MSDRESALAAVRAESLASEMSTLFATEPAARSALSVIELLAATPRPMTRQEICDALSMASRNLAACMTALENDGYLVSSRRFAVTLGVRFRHDPHLSRVFRETTLALVKPYLDVLTDRFEGTASLAFLTGTSCSVAESTGPMTPEQIADSCGKVVAQAIRGERPDHGAEGVRLPGVWAGYASPDTIVTSSRVRFTGGPAALSLTTGPLSLTDFSEVAHIVAVTAGVVTSSLRRVFPIAA